VEDRTKTVPENEGTLLAIIVESQGIWHETVAIPKVEEEEVVAEVIAEEGVVPGLVLHPAEDVVTVVVAVKEETTETGAVLVVIHHQHVGTEAGARVPNGMTVEAGTVLGMPVGVVAEKGVTVVTEKRVGAGKGVGAEKGAGVEKGVGAEKKVSAEKGVGVVAENRAKVLAERGVVVKVGLVPRVGVGVKVVVLLPKKQLVVVVVKAEEKAGVRVKALVVVVVPVDRNIENPTYFTCLPNILILTTLKVV